MAKSRTRLHAELIHQIQQDPVSGDIITIVTDPGATTNLDNITVDTAVINTTLNVNGNTVLGDGPADTVDFNADIASNMIPAIDGTYDLGNNTFRWRTLYVDNISTATNPPANTVSSLGGTTLGNSTTNIGTNTAASAVNTVNIGVVSGTNGRSDINIGTGGQTSGNRTDITIGSAHADVTLRGDTINIGGSATNDVVSFDSRVGTNFIPSAAGRDLGDTTRRWDLFAQTINSSGNSTFGDGATDDHTFNGDVDMNHALNVDGAVTMNGNVTLGNANTDNIVINGRLDSHLVPDDDNTYDLGATGLEWKDLYIDGIAYLDRADVTTLRIDGTQNLTNKKSFTIKNSAGTAQLAGYLLSTSNTAGTL